MGTAKRERQKTNRQERLQQIEKQQARRQTKRRGLVIGGFVAAFIAVAAIIAITTGGDDEEATTDTTVAAATTLPGATTVPTEASTTECPPADGSAAPTVMFDTPPPTCIDATKTYAAAVETNKGSFTIALDAAAAPLGVNNFVVLARYHYYDGTPCHRIISGYMAQCGDPAGTGSGPNPGYSIAEEKPADVSAYAPGVVAMANTGQPTSTGGQFFVMVGQGPPPPTPDYTIIGTVSDGFDTTVKAIEAAADPAADNGVPTLEPITITSITITES